MHAEHLNREEHILSVSQLTGIIKELLETAVPAITVEGEISNFRPASSGHLYFSLKDNDAIISCVMFKYRARGLSFTPEDGQLVRMKGKISVYAKRGNYQIICDSMQKAGMGDILAMLEQRKQRLQEEGLFDSDRKKPLPLNPERVAVVTSPTGAAIKDILRVLRRRSSGINLVILPALVQGEGAAAAIAAQIRRANIFNLGDVLIIGRGGGSLEDLLPFSEEIVVRAVAESEIPVISAVGHEIDISLSDLAADKRAATPSAAAEMVAADRMELLSKIREMKNTLMQTVENRLTNSRALLKQFSQENLEYSFQTMIQPTLLRLDDAKEELVRAMEEKTKDARYKLSILSSTIESADPKGLLKRGYAIVKDKKSGKIVSRASETSEDQHIDLQFHDAAVPAVVQKKEKE